MNKHRTLNQSISLSLAVLVMCASPRSSSAPAGIPTALKLASAHLIEPSGASTGIGAGGSLSPSASCEDALSSVEQDACLQTSYDASNKNLSDIYQQMLHSNRGKLGRDAQAFKSDPENPIVRQAVRADQEIQQRILASQRMWIQFRDANCNLEAAVNIFGSGEGTQNLICLNTMTLARAEELKKIADSIFNK